MYKRHTQSRGKKRRVAVVEEAEINMQDQYKARHTCKNRIGNLYVSFPTNHRASCPIICIPSGGTARLHVEIMANIEFPSRMEQYGSADRHMGIQNAGDQQLI
jgi:hypothetical protein